MDEQNTEPLNKPGKDNNKCNNSSSVDEDVSLYHNKLGLNWKSVFEIVVLANYVGKYACVCLY